MTIEARVRNLEKQNKLLIVILAGITFSFSSAVLLGATSKEPKVVTATKFVLEDVSGKRRAEWSSTEKAVALQLLNNDGSRALILAASRSGNAAYVADQTGKIREGLSVEENGTATFSMIRKADRTDAFNVTDKADATVMTMRDAAGYQRVNLGFTASGAALLIADAKDIPRIAAGQDGIVTYDKGGDVTWASFGQDLSREERKRVLGIVNAHKAP